MTGSCYTTTGYHSLHPPSSKLFFSSTPLGLKKCMLNLQHKLLLGITLVLMPLLRWTARSVWWLTKVTRGERTAVLPALLTQEPRRLQPRRVDSFFSCRVWHWWHPKSSNREDGHAQSEDGLRAAPGAVLSSSPLAQIADCAFRLPRGTPRRTV